MILTSVLKDRESRACCEGQWFSQSIDRTGTEHPDTKLPRHLEKKGKGRALRGGRIALARAEIEAIHSNPELAKMSLGPHREAVGKSACLVDERYGTAQNHSDHSLDFSLK